MRFDLVFFTTDSHADCDGQSQKTIHFQFQHGGLALDEYPNFMHEYIGQPFKKWVYTTDPADAGLYEVDVYQDTLLPN